METKIDMGWIGTDGTHFHTPCITIPLFYGTRFYCDTHHNILSFGEQCKQVVEMNPSIDLPELSSMFGIGKTMP